ncbi:hypothetical protein EH31_16900 [Erythrobacter longus]|uniref:Serine kinase n=2 Tax=Erythrobacter longus TaxID=1044 RepID=A0A074M5Q9_ERYLO|nr:hypothetical protein EH31_16900 [Erythrobacter longus]
MTWMQETPREQSALINEPYDRWVAPGGVCMAEFRREGSGFLIRFPGQADFSLQREGETFAITGWPTPDCDGQTLTNLYHNAIEPILGNHHGGLYLHGSAVVAPASKSGTAEDGVIAFLGLSRGGKTTLAGSFARAGFPFLTEDVIDLRLEDGTYWLKPKRSKLRLFADSARFLLGDDTEFENDDLKQDVEAGKALPFAQAQAPLRQIFLLGTDHAAPLSIRQLSSQEALGALMPHAFILDVTDKARLKGHFTRMADLSQDIACYALDFTRDYAELPRVRSAVLEAFSSLR